jgi:aminocarboxymuconate-semialdehyde decarboxylase
MESTSRSSGKARATSHKLSFSVPNDGALHFSSANPWLDFLPFSEAQVLAQQLNADLEDYCASGPSVASAAEFKRLYGMGLLPLVPGAPADSLSEAVSQLATRHPHIRGIVMGTRGVGSGLDDPALEPLWAALAETGLVVFLHPHYGVGAQAWGPRDNGHVLPLALGFPFETTTVCASAFRSLII